MQQKLLSLAIAGALAIPGAAMADVTSGNKNFASDVKIYGKFHASYDVVDNSATDDDTDDNTAAFRNSRLGFKGEESIGDGSLKGIWQVETQLNTAGDNVSMRNTYVGLKGDSWGKIFFGKHDTPYKMSTAKMDIFSDTIADYNNIIGAHMTSAGSTSTSYAYGTGSDTTVDGSADLTDAPSNAVEDQTSIIASDTDGDGTDDLETFGYYYASTSTSDAKMASNFNEREPQVVAYVTPKFNGFQAAVARESFQYDEEDGDDEREGWSAMATFDQGNTGLFASVAYEIFSGGIKNTTADDDTDAWKIGLGYTFDNPGKTTLGFVYEDIDHDADNSPMSRDAFWGSFSHQFGSNVVKLAYGKADNSEASDDDGADNWSIGLDHNFSNRTKVYAIYTHMDNDDDAKYGLYTANNNGAGDTGGYYTSDWAGKDLDAFSVGIIHQF